MTHAHCSKYVLCFGDMILDHYIYGDVSRISPEAPIPILKQKNETYTLGGSANVIRNLSALEVPTLCFGIVDTSKRGESIAAMMNALPFIKSELIADLSWHTPKKTRLTANNQQLLRLDDEQSCQISKALEEKVFKCFENHLAQACVIILSDYDKGFLSPSLCQKIIKKAKEANVPVLVDPKGSDYSKYRDAFLLSPNLTELHQATKCKSKDQKDIIDAANGLKKEAQVNHILVTLSAEGMLLVNDENDQPYHIKAAAKEVYDVSGAGDTVIATLAMGLFQGKSLTEAAILANKAGGIVVGKVGTAVVYPHELLHSSFDYTKIHTLSSLLEKVAKWKLEAKKVGFTNGCFDLLHLGHLHLLKQARQQCDKLIVAMNSDASIRDLKGPDRPIQQEHVRAEVLAALSMVDAVIMFSDETPLNLIQSILPDVLIKGADYTVETVVGAEDVIKNRGQVFLAELMPGQSTTNTVKILQNLAN
jgi:D-beta-D-heptose 7-phosphate kinase/D-beta-D-heptose 1-phosphate adenosyltransferase